MATNKELEQYLSEGIAQLEQQIETLQAECKELRTALAEATKFKVPKSIAGHEAVQECLDGYSEGFDYRYDVFLKEGYVFRRGRMAGSRHGSFNTVADFLHTEPVKTLPEAP